MLVTTLTFTLFFKVFVCFQQTVPLQVSFMDFKEMNFMDADSWVPTCTSQSFLLLSKEPVRFFFKHFVKTFYV